MYARVRRQFSPTAMVLSIIAIVLALTGAAFAKGLFTKAQEKKITQIAKKYAGQDGAPGAEGKQGPPGTNGTNGKDGANGKSVSVTASAGGSGEACEGPGGAEVKQEGAASGVEVCNGEEGQDGAPGESPVGTSFTGGSEPADHPCSGVGGVEYEVAATQELHTVCNGKEGSPWTTGSTLPVGIGAEEHGVWYVSTPVAVKEEEVLKGESPGLWAPISLPIRLASASSSTYYSTEAEYAKYCENKGGENVLVKNEFQEEVSPGVFVNKPTPANTLCVRQLELSAAMSIGSPFLPGKKVVNASRFGGGVGVIGGYVPFTSTGAGQAFGIWAVQG